MQVLHSSDIAQVSKVEGHNTFDMYVQQPQAASQQAPWTNPSIPFATHDSDKTSWSLPTLDSYSKHLRVHPCMTDPRATQLRSGVPHPTSSHSAMSTSCAQTFTNTSRTPLASATTTGMLHPCIALVPSTTEATCSLHTTTNSEKNNHRNKTPSTNVFYTYPANNTTSTLNYTDGYNNSVNRVNPGSDATKFDILVEILISEGRQNGGPDTPVLLSTLGK
uniref:Uncharacterized protein n=1 Tax=Lygus hesperus TaxID=30085 RepID=A0A146L8H7_LYGHE